MFALLALAAAQVLETLPPFTVTLSRECGEGCPIVLRQGAESFQVPDLPLPAGAAKRQGAQWAVDDVFFSFRLISLGRDPALLIELLRVPPGEERAMAEWRVVASSPLRQLLAFRDKDPSLGIGRVTYGDGVLHLTHDVPGDAAAPDRFDHAAWDWNGARLRPLESATVYAVAVGAGPSLEQMRRIQHEVEAGCRDAGALRTYEAPRFEGIPQQYFAGKVFLRRQDAEAVLAQVKPCAPTAEIFDTALQ